MVRATLSFIIDRGQEIHMVCMYTECFCSQKLKNNNYFLDTLSQKTFFFIMKINNFRGDLADISAQKEALVCMYTVFRLQLSS